MHTVGLVIFMMSMLLAAVSLITYLAVLSIGGSDDYDTQKPLKTLLVRVSHKIILLSAALFVVASILIEIY